MTFEFNRFYPLFLFTFLWIGSMLMSILALYMFIIGINRILILTAFISYYTFRYYYPATENATFKKWYGDLMNKNGYFKSHNIIYENEDVKEVLKKPNNKFMLCWSPHGILCLSWTL